VNAAQAVQRLRDALGERVIAQRMPAPHRVYLEVAPQTIREASRLLFETLEARFQIASGVDTPDAIEVLYHWALDGAGCVVTVLTRLDRDAPVIDSITPVCVAAEWIEREMWELLGIQFRGHPDLRHLLLDDDRPDGQYPLRRDYRAPGDPAP
jgi:Ni,Fe-hydrogenase III component G